MERKTPHLTSLFLVLGLAVSGAPVSAAPGARETPSWQLAGEPAPCPALVAIQCSHWQAERPPGGTVERIGLHRYRVGEPPRAALLYLPGTFMNGSSIPDSEDHNLWFFLAQRGLDVFTVDYRTRAVPPSDDLDLSFMGEWTLERFTEDVRAAAAEARRISGRERLFVAGFSRGVTFAYALAAAEPEKVAGIVALDGYFKRRPGAKVASVDFEAELQKLREAGAWAHDVGGRRGWEARQQLMRAAMANPEAPALGEGEGQVGDQLAQVLHRAWGPGVLANPERRHTPDGVSKPSVLARMMERYDRYYPRVQDIEGKAFGSAIDDPRTPIDDGWATLRMPVIFFGSTGMGTDFLIDGLHSAAHVGGPEAEIHVLERHGHLDVLVGERSREEVFEPLLDWFSRHSSD